MKLTLPYPPSMNTYWRKWRNRMVISDHGRRYRRDVALLVHQHRGRFEEPVRLGVAVDLWQPDGRRRDIDNTQKCLLDSLVSSEVIGDDSQIDELHIKRCGVDRRNPRVEVTIEVL